MAEFLLASPLRGADLDLATALAKDLALVTRNVRDFAAFGVPHLNPWDE